MTPKRYLIVNADDFGLSPGVNQGIATAHEKGIVTSTSLMVRQPAAKEAVEIATRWPALSVGLHLDLCEWVYQGEDWRPVYQVVPLEDVVAVEAEVARQLAGFRDLMGCDPTHLDSHQHVHRTEPVRSVALQLARELGVPLRGEVPGIRYCGDFYGQSDKGYCYHDGIAVEAVLKLLESLPPGTTEMGCHPAAKTDVASVYRDERLIELQTLCDARVRDALAGQQIELCSYRDSKGFTGEPA